MTPNPIVESSVKPQPHQLRPFYHRFLLALGLSAGAKFHRVLHRFHLEERDLR